MMWLSDQAGEGPQGVLGGAMNDADRRNLRYLAARLGPIPGWSMGYGYDTENLRTVSGAQLDQWKAYLKEHLGWDHFIGTRVGFDEGGPKGGPKPPLDKNRNAPIGDEYCSWLGGDYLGYTSYRPLYDRYVWRSGIGPRNRRWKKTDFAFAIPRGGHTRTTAPI